MGKRAENDDRPASAETTKMSGLDTKSIDVKVGERKISLMKRETFSAEAVLSVTMHFDCLLDSSKLLRRYLV